MTSDNARAIAYGVGALAIAYAIYKVVDTVQKTGLGLGDSVKKAVSDASTSAANVAETINGTIRNTVSSVAQSVGLSVDNGYVMPAEYNTRELPFSQWPKTAIMFIDTVNKKRGETGYNNWHVYSDGTITGPYRDYYTDTVMNDSNNMNVLVIGRAAEGGFLSGAKNEFDPFAAYKPGSLSLVDQIPY